MTPAVVAAPPRSGVRASAGGERRVDGCRDQAAASPAPRWSSSIAPAPDRADRVGDALPAMSGAERSARTSRGGRARAGGWRRPRPRLPLIAAPRSVRMSPKRLEPTITVERPVGGHHARPARRRGSCASSPAELAGDLGDDSVPQHQRRARLAAVAARSPARRRRCGGEHRRKRAPSYAAAAAGVLTEFSRTQTMSISAAPRPASGETTPGSSGYRPQVHVLGRNAGGSAVIVPRSRRGPASSGRPTAPRYRVEAESRSSASAASCAGARGGRSPSRTPSHAAGAAGLPRGGARRRPGLPARMPSPGNTAMRLAAPIRGTPGRRPPC